MLDQSIKEELTNVFSKLFLEIELVYAKCDHQKQNELIEMLLDLSQTSNYIKMKESSDIAPFPQFKIFLQGKETGISFLGIPGGHEFTSLIVAILNLQGLGKMPDENILLRIKNIKAPVRLRTYVSLSCETCPEVIQALNLMAAIHPDFKHQMIDGAFVEDEIKNFAIQAVPSVMNGSTLIHAGKIELIDLILKLEKTFGTSENKSANLNLGEFEVVIIGGGPAGSSAAIYASRKGLKTAILAEKIGGQVKETKGIENLIGTIYTEGEKLSAQLKEHLRSYPITILEHRRVSKIESSTLKKIELESGEFLTTKAIIIATGAKWRELNIPGEKEYIGRGVAFCPHCDGPFYKNKKVAVVGGGNSGVEAAIDLAKITKEVILFEFLEELKADKVLVEKLKSLPNISIITNAKTEQIIGDGKKVIGLNYTDRQSKLEKKVELDGVFVQIGLLPNSQIVKDMVETTKFGEIIIDVKGRTNVPFIYAAGDVTTVPYKQIIIAMGEGAKAGLSAFEDLYR